MDLCVNRITVRIDVLPGTHQIFGTECGLPLQEIGLAGAEAARLRKDPDRNTGADDTRLTARNAGVALDTWVRSPDIAGESLQQPRLVSW